ncbi:MAG: acetyl-CoA C-acyltransferase, partial [Acidimicrobiia bacterium]|nr:acetyl-CoA C-acyltransferase [Acidimicrobiia bacterium]
MGAVITGIARTAIGKFGGSLSSLRAVDLGARAIEGALERSGLDAHKVDEVIFGQVL